MPRRKQLTINDVERVVEREGFSYAVQHYLSDRDIKDPKLAALWKKARLALDRVESYVEVNKLSADEELNS